MSVPRPTHVFRPEPSTRLEVEHVYQGDYAPESCADRVFANMCLYLATSYEDLDAGYTSEIINDHLTRLEPTYPDRFKQALAAGDVYLLAQATVPGDDLQERKLKQGFAKVGPTTAPLLDRSATEIKEIVAPDKYGDLHMGSALLYLAIKDLHPDEPVHGRILGYNHRALSLAQDSLGMRLIRRSSGYPFGSPPKGLQRLRKKGQLKEVDWSWYGALAGDMVTRLVAAQPWLKDGYEDA